MGIQQNLRNVIQAVQSAAALPEGLYAFLNKLSDFVRCDAAAFFVCEDSRGEYVLAASLNIQSTKSSAVRVKYGKGLLGYVGESEAPLSLARCKEHEAYYRSQRFDDSIYAAFLGVPVIEDAVLLGILVLYREDAVQFDDADNAFCLTSAINLAPIIASENDKGNLLSFLSRRRRAFKDLTLVGTAASPGVAVGQAVVLYPVADLDAVPDQPAGSVALQEKRFDEAVLQASRAMGLLCEKAKQSLSEAESAIFSVYLRILDSQSFTAAVKKEIRQDQWAEGALRRVIRAQIGQLEALDDPYLRERASDFRDIGQRILFFLQEKERASITYHPKTILISDDLSATALLEVPKDKLLGVISKSGTPNSHVAILARAMGIPAVVGLRGIPVIAFRNQEVIVDGYYGQVYLSPSRALLKEFRSFSDEERELDDELSRLSQQPATTLDNQRISLMINTGLAIEAEAALRVGAEGVGLYRSEMPFMLKERFPSENEQFQMYRQLLKTFSPRPVYMRTLDVGGDKPLPYFPIAEENPFLGWRGIRVTLDHPELFLQQTRAMIRANCESGNLSILLPMISSISEVEESLRLIKQAHKSLTEEGLCCDIPKVGSMVEVPSAVFQSYELAQRVSFLSVGSNDLTQYLLAVDRNNARVSDSFDSLHPAVLRALAQVVENGHRAGKPVSLCGEMSSDPLAVILLLAMGFDSLSMNARMLPRIKWVIRSISLQQARSLLEEALAMHDPVDVRLLLEAALDAAGLGGLIRAGRR